VDSFVKTVLPEIKLHSGAVFDRYNIINQEDLKDAVQKQERYLQLQNGYNPGRPPNEKAPWKGGLIVMALFYWRKCMGIESTWDGSNAPHWN
jgi:hypothetical protein